MARGRGGWWWNQSDGGAPAMVSSLGRRRGRERTRRRSEAGRRGGRGEGGGIAVGVVGTGIGGVQVRRVRDAIGAAVAVAGRRRSVQGGRRRAGLRWEAGRRRAQWTEESGGGRGRRNLPVLVWLGRPGIGGGLHVAMGGGRLSRKSLVIANGRSNEQQQHRRWHCQLDLEEDRNVPNSRISAHLELTPPAPRLGP